MDTDQNHYRWGQDRHRVRPCNIFQFKKPRDKSFGPSSKSHSKRHCLTVKAKEKDLRGEHKKKKRGR